MKHVIILLCFTFFFLGGCSDDSASELPNKPVPTNNNTENQTENQGTEPEAPKDRVSTLSPGEQQAIEQEVRTVVSAAHEVMDEMNTLVDRSRAGEVEPNQADREFKSLQQGLQRLIHEQLRKLTDELETSGAQLSSTLLSQSEKDHMLYLAARYRVLSAVQQMIAVGANVNFQDRSSTATHQQLQGSTPLHMAALFPKIIQELLKQPNIHANHRRDFLKLAPLHIAASPHKTSGVATPDQLGAIQALASHQGINVNITGSSWGDTPLHIIVGGGKRVEEATMKVLKVLFDANKNIDVNVQNAQGSTPLDNVIPQNQQIQNFLRARGAKKKSEL